MSGMAIKAENLTRDFGNVRAVDGLSLEVPPGTVFGFLGPNGAGKTTTIRLLLGLLEPTGGRAEVLGFDTQTQAEEVRRRTGALLEHPGLYERLSAEDNLEFYGRAWRLPAAAVAYGWGLTVLSLALGLITVNVAHGHGELLLYPTAVVVGGLVLSLLGASLVAGAGVLVSLRAPTARQAQQTLGMAIMLLLFVPALGVQALPAETKGSLVRAFMGADVPRLVLAAAVVLAALDAAVLAAAMARFQRARLILD